MKGQEDYPMSPYFRKDIQAQASIEFSIAFVLALLLMILSCNLFVWLNHNIVQRQNAYRETRIIAASSPDADRTDGVKGDPGKLDFYVAPDPNDPNKKPNPNYRPLNIFVLGGYNK